METLYAQTQDASQHLLWPIWVLPAPALYLYGRLSAIMFLHCAQRAVADLWKINVKNFHGSLTTVVRAQNDTTKTANITDTIFDRTLV